jgi:MoxR-like ATPase
VDDLLRRWIVELVRTTRDVEMCTIGASVRGTLALERAARAWALLDEREYVTSDDVEQLFIPVIAHRVGFRPAFRAQARRSGWDDALEEFQAACLRIAPAPELRQQPA